MKAKKIVALVMIAALAMMALAGCQGGSSDKLGQIKKNGVLVVGTSADYAPFEFHKVINGKDEIVGFEMAMAKKLADDLGVKLVIKDMELKGLVAAMNTGKVDVLIAGMNPTPERAENADFSVPYYEPKNSMMVKAGTESNFTTVKSFEGKKVGVQIGSTQEALAKEKLKGSELLSLSKIPTIILQLNSGKIDGMVINTTVGKSYEENNPGVKMTNLDLGSEGKVVVLMPKGEATLKQAVDKSIEGMVNDKLIDQFVVEANKLNN